MSHINTQRHHEDIAKPGRYWVPALAGGLRVLEFLTSRPQGAKAAEIASELAVPVASAFRMLTTLVDLGYLRKDVAASTYRLSRKLLSLGYAAVDSAGLVEKSVDIMRKLRDATGETALLAVLSGTEGIVLEQTPSTQAVKVLVQVGHRFPLHTAAPGKAIMAFLPDAELQTLLKSLTLQRFTPRTITSRAALIKELAGVRRCKVAYDRGEELQDLRCVSSPILDGHGYPLAALWVSGPASRIRKADFARFADLVKQHADLVSERFTC